MTTKVKIPKSTFKKDWKLFFARQHKNRCQMIDRGVSRKDNTHMRRILNRLQPYVNYNYTEQATALFIINNKADIRLLISEHSKLAISRFELFVTQANVLVNLDMI